MNPQADRETGQLFVIHPKELWKIEPIFKWTIEEIENADDKGLIGRKYGIDCYISRHLPTTT